MARFLSIACVLLAGIRSPAAASPAPAGEDASSLAAEVKGMGWIVFSARSDRGDWDLFLSRPDGSDRRNITATPDLNEAAPQFSRDGARLLYRRLQRAVELNGNAYGTQGALVLARSDGSEGRVLGAEGEHPWASWSPDGRQIASLSIRGIAFFDLESEKVIRTMPRRGFFQQMTWSPDGKWLCGVANSFDTGWSIARMDAETGSAQAVNRVDCCTPDWFPDSKRIIFSWRPPGQKGNGGQGWTQLWMAGAEGEERKLVYGEDGRHVYGGHVSPDCRYALFTGNVQENGDPERAGAPMGIIRLADAPIIGGVSEELRKLYPGARNGPVLVLSDGWEPCWTSSERPGGGGKAPASQGKDR